MIALLDSKKISVKECNRWEFEHKLLLQSYKFLKQGIVGNRKYKYHINNYHIWNLGADKLCE